MFQFNTSSNTQEDTLSASKVTQRILTLSFVFFLYLSFEGIIWSLSSLGTAACSIQSVDSTITCVEAQSLSRVWLRSHGLQPARLLCPWISLARILEWVAISFSRWSSWPRDRTHVSCSHTGKQILYHCGTWEAHIPLLISLKKNHPHRHTKNNV